VKKICAGVDGSYERYGSSYTVTFNLPEGVNERTYAVKLKVRDNDRQYGYKTVYVTVKRPKHFYFYVKDHLGSTRAVVDEAGDVVEAYDYYPFGLQSRSYKEKGDPLTKETFTGKEQDTESNLHYFGARYYDPSSVKWLSIDPLGFKYPSLSSYVYAANNPIIIRDPNGLDLYILIEGEPSGRVENAKPYTQWNEGEGISGSPFYTYKMSVVDDNFMIPPFKDPFLHYSEYQVGRDAWYQNEDHSGKRYGTNNETRPGDFSVLDRSEEPDIYNKEKKKYEPTKGKARGWLSINDAGKIYGTITGDDGTRYGISIHPGNPNFANGCLTMDQDQYNDFKKKVIKAIKNGEKVRITILPRPANYNKYKKRWEGRIRRRVLDKYDAASQ
jgi:RHS repeat-associated protein